MFELLSFLFSETYVLELYKYSDPVSGPRTIPKLEQPLAGLEKITDSDKFSIDTSKNMVLLNGKTQYKLVYTVTKPKEIVVNGSA